MGLCCGKKNNQIPFFYSRNSGLGLCKDHAQDKERLDLIVIFMEIKITTILFS